jgi:NTP pyrophosphatase (non-canonical NTP hydrolase)
VSAAATPPSTRTLDEWYKTINRIYLDRNYDRDAFSLFTHLVEVVGGLSLLASDKTKSKVDPDAFVPKSIAWWMALCGRFGVVSVEAMLWAKFPHACPYCERNPHDEGRCLAKKRTGASPDWESLARLGDQNRERHPSTLDEWQRMFYELYPPTQSEQYAVVFARLSEELGELAEALRAFSLHPAYLLSEASDVFAWLMHLRNLRDVRTGTAPRLGEAFWDVYPDACRDCGNVVCTCPPVLADTLGRIAQENKTPQANFKPGGNLVSAPEAEALFRLGPRGVRIGAETILVDAQALRDFASTLAAVREIVERSEDLRRSDAARMVEELERSSAGGQLLQAQIDALAAAVRSMKPRDRDHLIEFLTNMTSNVWSAALLQIAISVAR